MSPEQQKDPLIGMTLGGCRIQALLGRGGMGTVYRAHHIALDKPVALKVLAGHLESDVEFVERFQREARAAAKVEHPNVIQVLNVAEEKAQHFIILQFIDGENLEQMLDRSGKLDLQTATRIARDAAAGLEGLHAKSIVHRDIKPANIMLAKDGTVKITDFGLARNLKATSNFTTVSGAFMGTPGFIAPEQVDGPSVDHRADLYSLGVVYYMMLSNELPFNAINALEMATQRVTLDPIPLEDRVPGVDPRAAEIVRKLLQKDVTQRYQDAASLRAELDALLPPPPAGTSRRESAPPESIIMPSSGEETMLDMGRRTKAPKPPPPAPPERERGTDGFWKDEEPVPEVEIYGRRRPPPPKATPVQAEDVVPEISAGPKKRVVENAELIKPREIPANVQLPAKPPKQKPLRAEDLPSNPALREESTKKRPAAAEVAPPPKWKHQPPPKKDAQIGQNIGFWLMILLGCSCLFALGTVGVPLKAGDGFWTSLPRPFITPGGDFVLRLGLAVGGIGLLVAAFVVNKKSLKNTSHPGPAVMMPIFAALLFYAAGLTSPATGKAEELVLSGFSGTMQLLVHPVNLAVLGLWALIVALMFGLSGNGDLDYSAGSIFLMLSLGAIMGFAAGGNIPAIVGRCMENPKMLVMPGGAIAATFLGLFLAFSPRAGAPRRFFGIVVIVAALGLGYYGGVQSTAKPDLMAPVHGIGDAVLGHGLAFVLGLTLLTLSAWILHKMKLSSFGAR